MNEDAAFIRAIRERPDDETTRLVYADWLDDRSDPRAEYLRAEAAWVALQPSDEQFRPLYRRVSQLAATLDPEWFADVSRTGNAVRRAWEPVSEGFSPQRSPHDRFREWKEGVGELRELFVQAFGAEEIEHRFCPPVDFSAFMCAIGGQGDGWERYTSSWALAGANRTSVEMYRPGQPSGSGPFEEDADRATNPEMWLEFGGWSDKHWYFVCCDLGSPLFGVIAEGHDYHPWMSGSEGMSYRGRNFLHFLTGYQRSRQDDGEEWPRVPHRDWATF